MSEVDDPPESSSEAPGKRWQGRLIAALLIAAGILHAIKPTWLSLDWPSIALILVGILLLFLPIDDLGSVIESLEIGKTKILFRKVQSLHEEVQNAIGSAQLDGAASSIHEKLDLARGRRILESPLGSPDVTRSDVTPGHEEPTAPQRDRPRDDSESQANSSRSGSVGSRIRTLLDTDKEMALIEIGIEIEQAIDGLIRKSGLEDPASRFLARRDVTSLSKVEEITPEIALALVNFRKVRNQIIHSRQSPVPATVLNSAIDSGLELLRYLVEKL